MPIYIIYAILAIVLFFLPNFEETYLNKLKDILNGFFIGAAIILFLKRKNRKLVKPITLMIFL